MLHCFINSCLFGIFLTAISCVLFDGTIADDISSPCGNWEVYKDEKCFKIVDKVETQENAEKICKLEDNNASLVTIHSKEEQEFFSNLLFQTYKVVDNVWIWAEYTNNKLRWVDDSKISFTNWAVGSPKNGSGNSCVQILAEGSSRGMWVEEPCYKRNLVVCQKMQIWSLSRLQKNMLESRKELTDLKQQFTEEQISVKKELNSLKQNPVPIGFIYVQMSGQPAPNILWPMVEWKDFSSEYAGLFFRVLGGDSAEFDVAQNYNSPRLIAVQHLYSDCDNYKNSINISSNNEWSELLNLSVTGEGGRDCVRFMESSGEVRPRNKAMRIWKRTK